MTPYLNDIQHILRTGEIREDRTGVGTVSVFGLSTTYDLKAGFPAVTTKKLAWKAMLSELLWFIEGSNDERRLAELLHGSRDSSKDTIWTANARAPYWVPKAQFPGDLGSIYGVQWRSWGRTEGRAPVDQLKTLIEGLKRDPYGRRHIITAWNPGELENMALPPCHCFAQFYVGGRGLSCQMYQRSNDFFLGGPFNIASYALFTHMIAQVCGYEVDRLIHVNGDAHIYLNHINQVTEQCSREPMPLSTVWLNPAVKDIEGFTMDDIRLDNYQHHPPITAPMAV